MFITRSLGQRIVTSKVRETSDLCLLCYRDPPRFWYFSKIEISSEDPLVAFCWENNIILDDMFEVIDESEMDS